MKQVLGVMVLFFLGCGDAEHLRYDLAVYVAPGEMFTAGDVMAGCAAWAPVGVTCSLAGEADANTWVRAYEKTEEYWARGSAEGLVMVNVLTWASVQREHLEAAILGHEFGHRLGVGHLAGGVGLMTASPTVRRPELTERDVDAFWRSR